MPARPQRRRPPQERQVFGLTILHPSHPEVQRLQHDTARPGLHGHKVWPASFVLLDYLHQRGVAPQARVLELGCGWGLVGIACAKTFQAQVTGLDADAAVFPYLQLHAQRNGVHLATRHGTFADLTPGPRGVRADRGGRHLLLGGLVDPLYQVVRRGVAVGVADILLADLVGPRLTSSVHGVCSTATPRCSPGRRRHPSGKAAGFSGWSALPRPQWAARRVGSPQRHRRRSWPRTVTTVRGGQHGAVRHQEAGGSLTGRPVSTLRSQTGIGMGQGIGALAAADSVGIDHARNLVPCCGVVLPRRRSRCAPCCPTRPGAATRSGRRRRGVTVEATARPVTAIARVVCHCRGRVGSRGAVPTRGKTDDARLM